MALTRDVANAKLHPTMKLQVRAARCVFSHSAHEEERRGWPSDSSRSRSSGSALYCMNFFGRPPWPPILVLRYTIG